MGVMPTANSAHIIKADNAAKRSRRESLQSFGLEKPCIGNLIQAIKGFNISQSGSS